MAVTMAEITKLRKISGAGMMDCKNALTEANGDIDKAMEIIRKKGQAVAAKRSDREASEGCVLAKSTGQFAAIIALKCETDFVAKNADFVALTQAILDAAVANKCKTLDEVKALPLGNGTVQDAVTDRSGITGEKMELDGYNVVEGAYTSIYNHQGNNQLCTIVAMNKEAEAAAKRSDREASEGCVLAKSTGQFAAIIALKCETDFVAKNADFVALTQAILDAAVANKCKTLDEVKALPLGNGTVQDAVTDRSGITGEKMELDGYNVVEGAYTSIYNHQGNNQLCTIVAMNKEAEAAAHGVAMQIAAMNPIAIDEAGVPESVKEAEIQVAIDKTKKEQVDKAVEAALKKAGINPAHVDSEEHMESNKAKGWITDEDIAKAKEIIATVSAEKSANLPEAMIQNIAKGRLGKFLKEVCLLNQEDIMDGKKTVREVLKEIDPELQIVAFKRFTLRAE